MAGTLMMMTAGMRQLSFRTRSRALVEPPPSTASLTTADSATVTIVDNEIDGVSSDAFGSIFHVTELGSTTYEVVLDTDPLEDVVVTISSGDSTAVQVQKSTDAAAEMVTLTFTTSDWDTAQTVTVTAVDDVDTDREQVTLSHAVSGYGAVTDAGTVMIVVLDDEATDFAVLYEPADAQLTLVEGGPSKTVRHGVEPSTECYADGHATPIQLLPSLRRRSNSPPPTGM